MGSKKTTKKRVPVKQFKTKMIDLSADKTSPQIRKAVREIESNFRQQAKSANIPAINVLYKILTLESFFLNHTDYEAILGKNVDLVDRMMLTAISDTIAQDIFDSISEAGVHYVGVWDLHTLYSIVAATVTFMDHDSTVDKYLTPLQYKTIDDEALSKLPEGAYMPFKDYNPNRFYQQLVGIRQVALNTITGMMEHRIPKAFLSSVDYPLPYRMLDYYHTALHDALQPLYKTSEEELDYCQQPATEKTVREFTDIFEKPFLEMWVSLLHESGLSDNLINLMLGSSRIHLMYDDPEGKTTGDITITYILSTEKSGLPKATKVEYKVTIKQAVLAAEKDPKSFTKTAQEQFGKPMRSFLLDLCTYAINIYCDVTGREEPIIQDNQTQEGSAGVEDMDIEELDQLLGGNTEAETVK